MEPEPLKICKYGDEVLKVKATEIRDITSRIVDLAAAMTRTMHLAPGVGLAAPQ
ncbi:MAG TPA: peptide deformylase, partial [Acidobacteriota bacterium]